MAETVEAFVKQAREKGLDDGEIRRRLSNGGWPAGDIDAALDDLTVPPPPNSQAGDMPLRHSDHSRQPIAVVSNLSVRGFEYMVMFITLLTTAFSVGMLAHTFIDSSFNKATNSYSYGEANPVSSFAITLLIVSFPIFAYMFLRLKKAEITDPSLRKDPSRRKLTQFTQLITFLFGMGYIIYFIYALITPERHSYYSVSNSPGVLEQFLHTLVTLVIAGGIFVYYWRDEHREV